MRRNPIRAASGASSAVRLKLVCGGLLLTAAVALAGCSSGHSLKASTAHGRTPAASASAQASAEQAVPAAAVPASAAGTQSAVPWPSGTLTASPAAP